MKRVLHSFLTALVVACVALPSIAHSQKAAHGGGAGWSMKHLDKARAELGLTDEQVRQIEGILQETESRNRPLVAQVEAVMGERPDREAMRSMTKEQRRELHEKHRALMEQHPELKPVRQEIRANRKAAHERILSLLDAEQKKKLERMHEAKKGSRPGKHGDGAGHPADPNRI